MKNIKTKSIIPTTIVLLAAGLTVWFVSQRYIDLRIKHDIHLFFERARQSLPLESSDGGVSFGPSIPESIKKQPGNLMSAVMEINTRVAAKHTLDPFTENGGGLIELRYGTAIHPAIGTITLFGPDHYWFEFSRGPGGAPVKTRESEDENGWRRVEFISPPYEVSNGLRSSGYLYLDGYGGRVGFVPLVGMKEKKVEIQSATP
ncbi:MAG: hypothetical protein GC154_12120 [bacterium]|nr:hypothetical protein [bacterium]